MWRENVDSCDRPRCIEIEAFGFVVVVVGSGVVAVYLCIEN